MAQVSRSGESSFMRTRSSIPSYVSRETPPSKVKGHAGDVMSTAGAPPRIRSSPGLLHEDAETAASEARRNSYVAD